ncbi:DUF2231 domain-containing protein [Pigmentiphaga soli]|uniref:DUF2231 domain-containing protein n=1 Tax=Pigmentiphaga soli TaxID=1007095 RepID=UPI0031EE2664
MAYALYALLNPIPFGFFVAALIFDAVYARTGELLWMKSAAWLVSIGLLFAILPRLINLVHVWLPRNRVLAAEKWDFWLNLVAIVLAIVNAFVHSRDAYGAMPEGLWLSALTVLLLSLGFVLLAVQRAAPEETGHE